MKTVQKANKQLRVPDERLDDYLKIGYFEVVEKAEMGADRKSGKSEPKK